jgi:hypothetical protein
MPNSLLAGNIQGISSIRASAARQGQPKTASNQYLTGQFPKHPNREFFAALQGIKSDDQGNFRPDQGIPLSTAISAAALPTNRIVPPDLERCREGGTGTPPDARGRRSRSPARGRLCPCERRPRHAQIARRACRRERSAFRGFTMARGRVARGPGAPSSPQTGDREGSNPSPSSRESGELSVPKRRSRTGCRDRCQIHCARVLEVRIHSPPAVSPQTIGSATISRARRQGTRPRMSPPTSFSSGAFS